VTIHPLQQKYSVRSPERAMPLADGPYKCVVLRVSSSKTNYLQANKSFRVQLPNLLPKKDTEVHYRRNTVDILRAGLALAFKHGARVFSII
jgi:hypothetical protein